MTKPEVKSEINKLLDQMPDDFLQELLQYLKDSQRTDRKHNQIKSNLERVMKEDIELLKKLAE